jgi:apolipoprotein D and lipocalin family protein
MRIIYALTAALVLSACGLPPVNRSGDVPIGPVAQVEIARYAGKWFEIARLPNGFEENCEGVTAEYTSRPDGRITVLNTCRQGSPSGEARAQEGVARIVDTATNAKLKVSFGGPFEGDYWVLDRAEDYSWSLVGEPSGRFLWILARAPTIPDSTRENLLGRLQARGYDTAKLTWTQQPPG